MSRWAALATGMLLIAGCGDRAERVTGHLRVFPASLDFEQVAVHGVRELPVDLKNLGRGPLHVDTAWVDSADGVFAVQMTSDDKSVVPGGSFFLQIAFSPSEPGTHQGVLSVRTDNPNEPVFTLPLTGEGVIAAAELPQRLLDFGRIEAQSSRTMTLLIRNPSPVPVEVAARVIGADRDEFSPAPTRLEAGEEKGMEVTFSPERLGRKQAALGVTPCLGCAEEPVTLQGEALENALVAEPAILDFGQVPVDRELDASLGLRNISDLPVTLIARVLDPSSDPSFQTLPSTFPVVVPPRGLAQFPHSYTPGHMGEATGSTRFLVVSHRHPTLDVGLRGSGGAAELCVSPTQYDFGNQPVGSKTKVVVTVRNCGASNRAPLVVSDFAFESGDGSEYNNSTPLPFPATLSAGQEVRFSVFYEPSREGGAAVTYRLRTSAVGGDVQMRFSGTATAYAPCTLELKPAVAVDFGTLPPGQGGVLGIKVTNTGSEICAVKNIHVANDAGGVFFMPGGVIDGLVMYPGDYFSFQVGAHGQPIARSYLGSLELQPAATPTRTVPLTLNVQAGCLVATPPFLDFGLGRPDCPLETRQVNFRNACAAPVRIGGIFIGNGTTDAADPNGPEFRLVPEPAVFPASVAPGASFSLDVRYLGLLYGMNLSPLFVDEIGLTSPLLVPLLGEASATKDQTDHFVQQDGSKVDVLFVVDNSDSMAEEQAKLQSALPAFADAALARGVDLHVAFTTTGIEGVSNACPGGAQGGEAGRFFPVDGSIPRMMTQATPGLAGALIAHAAVGRCAIVEQGFEAVRRAFTAPLLTRPMAPPPNDGNAGFLRDEAALSVVFISDEDDHSPDDVETYARFLHDLKGAQQPQRAVTFAIAPTAACVTNVGGSGDRYADMARLTSGNVLGSCEDASAYATFLQQVANQSFSPQDRFPLSKRPEAGAVTVLLNGAPTTADWTYDVPTNTVIFSPPPPPGATIDLLYRPACM